MAQQSDRFTNLALAAQQEAIFVEAVRASVTPFTIETATDVNNVLGSPPDLVVRMFAGTRAGDLSLLYLENAAKAHVDPLLLALRSDERAGEGHVPLRVLLGPFQIKPLHTVADAVEALLSGKVAVASGSGDGAFEVSTESWPKRSPKEPPNEIVVHGPHKGMIETLGDNIAMIRQLVRTPRFRYERITAGSEEHTMVAFLYVAGVASPQLVASVRNRLREIDVEQLLSSRALQAVIGSWQGKLLPAMETTERPDRVAAALGDGRVALLIDGSPVATLLPTVLFHLLQSPGDYYVPPWITTIRRLLRIFALIASVLSSPVFVALTTVNTDVIPTGLFISMARTRQGVPLPVPIETLLVELFVEIIQEAGLRMPGPLGQTVTVVGAIIIGQSAVTAGLISAPVIVVVAFAYMSSFIIPTYNVAYALRYLRFPLVIIASLLGFYGIMWFSAGMLATLAALRSFGASFLSPVAPPKPSAALHWLYPYQSAKEGPN